MRPRYCRILLRAPHVFMSHQVRVLDRELSKNTHRHVSDAQVLSRSPEPVKPESSSARTAAPAGDAVRALDGVSESRPSSST